MSNPTSYTGYDFVRDNCVFRSAVPHSLQDGCCHYVKKKDFADPLRCERDAAELVEGWGFCASHAKQVYKKLEPFHDELRKLDLWNDTAKSMPSGNPVSVENAIGE